MYTPAYATQIVLMWDWRCNATIVLWLVTSKHKENDSSIDAKQIEIHYINCEQWMIQITHNRTILNVSLLAKLYKIIGTFKLYTNSCGI